MARQFLNNFKLRRIALCTMVLAVALPANSFMISHANSRNARAVVPGQSGRLTGAPDFASSVMYDTGGTAGCRGASPEESAAIARRDVTKQLRVISTPKLMSVSGLQIILRATPELDPNPQAKAAFMRAAEAWASRIEDPT